MLGSDSQYSVWETEQDDDDVIDIDAEDEGRSGDRSFLESRFHTVMLSSVSFFFVITRR